MTFKPYVYGRGDETVRRVGDMIQEKLFGSIPVEIVDLGVEARIASQDGVLSDFLSALKNCGAGVKMSTASDDPRVLEALQAGTLKKKSVNILLRPGAGVVGMLRMIPAPKGYSKPVAVFRYGSGGFYEEQSCEVMDKDGTKTAAYTTHMNLDNLAPFAELAMKLARQYGLALRVSSKWTIAKSEALFADGITSVWDAAGAEYKRILTDVGLATIATDREGGWLWLFDNPNGDSGSDIVDWIDGSRTMGSTLFCKDGSSYEELPGGTAPDKMETDLTGSNFFNPSGAIYAFISAIEQANPELSGWLGQVREAAIGYLDNTPDGSRGTEAMIDSVASAVAQPAAA